ncbi:MFS transporter [Thalassotalea psychrophila]|uniref:MFS transporter n=1 Tax=Thalassotalea psychrophila TaxID=3065647 RepID=A0ABY9TRC4_9GAMM|nr:MFS transporter [Colwelliaceae bacterium SQ149]
MSNELVKAPLTSEMDTTMKTNKIFYGWWIVIGTIIGLSLGYSVIAMSFGTFIKAFETSFGWTRGQISFGPTIIGITAIVFFPYVGRMIDKHGVKKILVPSTFLFALTIASMSLLTPSIWHLYAMCVVIPLLGAGTAPLTYSKLLVSWFNKKRGLALGIGLAGVGLGTTMVPLIASYFMEHYTWREAYLAIGVLILVIALPISKFIFKDKPSDIGLCPDGSTDAPSAQQTSFSKPNTQLVGYTTKEAIKQKTFWLMFTSFLITGLCTSTVLVHLIPMMTDRGMSIKEAIGTFAYLGMSIVGGRLLAGYLMDKFFAPYVVIAFMFGPVIGLALFAMGASGFEAAICTALIGIAIGAEFDVMAYFTSKYFGQRSFGEVYGYSYSGFKLGASIGPLIMGLTFDAVGRYTEVLWAMSAIMILCCVCILMMGKYPELPIRKSES